MNAENSKGDTNKKLVHFVALQLFAAMLLYFCDVLLASRSVWMGWSASEWVATMPGILLYGIYLFVVAGLFTILAKRFVLKNVDTRLLSSVATVIAIGSLALILHRFALPRVKPFVLTYGLSVGGVAAAVGLIGYVKHSIVWAGLCSVIGIISSLCLLQVFAISLVTLDIGSSSAIAYAAGWAGAVTVFSAIVYVTGHRTFKKKLISAVGIFVVAFALPIAILVTAPNGKSGGQPDRKNVVFITADTMRADYLSVYGGPVPTPNLKRLAERGVRFDQHYSLAPWTVPSVPALFSSRFPPGVTLDIPMEDRTKELSYYRGIQEYWEGEEGGSLVQNLSESGYVTNAFVGNFALFGFDWLLEDFDHHLVLPFRLTIQKGPLDGLPLLTGLLMKIVPDAYTNVPPDYTRTVTEYSQAFLRYRTQGNFFLWAHYLDPHAPYDPPERFRRIKDEPFDFFPQAAGPEMLKERDYIKSLYEGEIRYIDESVGKILDTLSQEGHDDDTIVVFSSDHGEEFWDHDQFGHGLSLYNEQLRVPFIIAGPGTNSGTIKTPVSAIDVIPTLADLLGRDRYSEWRGSSFKSLLENPSQKTPQRMPVFAQATGLIPPPPEPLQSVVVWPYKLIRGMETGTTWLYNLDNDPGELKNLVESEPSQVSKLSLLLARWSAMFPVTFEELINESGEINVHQDTLENLKSLGYLKD